MTAVVRILLTFLLAATVGPAQPTGSLKAGESAHGAKAAVAARRLTPPPSIPFVPATIHTSENQAIEVVDDDDPDRSHSHAASLLPCLATPPRLVPFRPICSRGLLHRSLLLLRVELRF